MSTYNEPIRWIEQSIDSILQQTFRAFEFIIINDNPNREELKILLEQYKNKDARVLIIENLINMGLTRSLNRGMELAQGDFIARMDADDIARSDRFEKQVSLMWSRPDVGVCGSNVRFFGELDLLYTFPEESVNMYWFLKTYIAHPASMIRSSILKGVYYDPKFVVSQDYALWVRLYEEGILMYNIQDDLLYYRKSKVQISTIKNDIQKKLSIGLRVKAFNYYCKINRINIEVKEGCVSLPLIEEIDKKIKLPRKEKQELLFDLLLSVHCGFWSYLILILKFSTRVSFKQFCNLFLYKIEGRDLQMF